MDSRNTLTLALPVLSVLVLPGCADLVVRDTASLLVPRFQPSLRPARA